MVVFTAQIEDGWLWSYEIDSGLPVMFLDDGHPNEVAAISVAEKDARRRIVAMHGV